MVSLMALQFLVVSLMATQEFKPLRTPQTLKYIASCKVAQHLQSLCAEKKLDKLKEFLQALSPDVKPTLAQILMQEENNVFWKLLTTLNFPESALDGYDSGFSCAEFRDNKLLTASYDGNARIHELDSQENYIFPSSETSAEGHGQYIEWASFSPDGKLIATASGDATIKLWDIETQSVVRTLNGHTKEIFSVAWNHDGTRLASGSEDALIKIWNTRDGTCCATLHDHNQSIYSLAWHPRTNHVLTGEYRGVCRIWDIEKKATVIKVAFDPDNAYSIFLVRWSPDGRYAFVASADHTAKMLDPSTGQCLVQLNDHTCIVTCISIHPTLPFALTGSFDGTVRLWNLSTNTSLVLKKLTKAYTVAWSTDGCSFFAGSKSITAQNTLMDLSSFIRLPLEQCIVLMVENNKRGSFEKAEGYWSEIIEHLYDALFALLKPETTADS